MMKQFAKLGLILAIFAAVACVGLSFVYAATKDPIEANKTRQVNESLKDLFADADEFVPTDVLSADPSITFQTAYQARKNGVLLGLAVKAAGSSYGGQSVLLVGTGLDRRIVGVRVLENKDTPGLGANAKNEAYFVDKANRITFPGQFAGKVVTDAFEVKKDVIPITASTITSKALTRIVKAAGDAAAAWIENAAMLAPETAPETAPEGGN
ncbi:MAG: FMN-binding protein [Rectinema sp.]